MKKPFCNSRALQCVSYVLCIIGAWGIVPVWELPMSPVWHGVFAWVVGSLIWLIFMACVYAIDSMFHDWEGRP